MRPKANISNFGINLWKYSPAKVLWYNVPFNIKSIENLELFKKKIRKCQPLAVKMLKDAMWKLCKEYVYSVAYFDTFQNLVLINCCGINAFISYPRRDVYNLFTYTFLSNMTCKKPFSLFL